MIIVKLIGGLGNQMFQYAAGRSIAGRLGTVLKLDIENFDKEGVTIRNYGLKIFRIQENIASFKDIAKTKIPPKGFLKYFPRAVKLLELLTGRSHIIETKKRIVLNKITDNSYLEGNWNSEKYFSGIGSILRKEFTFKARPDDKNRAILKQIQRCNSVSIHVRRGDYVTNSKVNKLYHICSLNYYLKATKIINKFAIKPVFFVFSDDPAWVKSNFSGIKPVFFVNHNTGEKSYEDMRLMSACQHNIIANSSFSWWGAWLNHNPSKIVIAPKKWFKDDSKNVDDLVPLAWIRI